MSTATEPQAKAWNGWLTALCVLLGLLLLGLVLIFAVWMSSSTSDCDQWKEQLENALIDDAMYGTDKTEAAVVSVQANRPLECR